MTMYLPNEAVRPVGSEPGEFLDAPPYVPPATPGVGTGSAELGDEDDETPAS